MFQKKCSRTQWQFFCGAYNKINKKKEKEKGGKEKGKERGGKKRKGGKE
jgi:hypothetical protein